MTEGGDDNLLKMSMCRTNSVRSMAAKGLDIPMMQEKYFAEIEELRTQVSFLETKNRKYLEIIGMTAGE